MQYSMMICFNQVSKRYAGGYEALAHVNFSLTKGEMVFVTGHSGAGKSTLLRLVALLESPSAGHITVDGQHLHQLNKAEMARHRARLGFMVQTPKLLTHCTLFENVALPLQVQGLPQKMIAKRVFAALEMVGLLSQ